MSNTHNQLVYMANQIARNFATMDEATAAQATAEHIRAYWTPVMRTALVTDHSGLTDIAASAFTRLRESA